MAGLTQRRASQLEVRRASSLVGYWHANDFYLENYLVPSVAHVSPLVLAVLDSASDYRSKASLVQSFPDLPRVKQLIRQLLALNFLLERDSDLDRLDWALQQKWAWGHSARFFHYRTQSVRYEEDLDLQRASVVALAQQWRPPPPYKEYERAKSVTLAHTSVSDPFFVTLKSRRTRRRFSARPLSLKNFSSILQWTWGSTQYIDHQELGPYILKTSPSGGARHPIEVYPIVLNVVGIAPGLYHYSVRKHSLALLREGDFRQTAIDMLAKQPWVGRAAAVFLMTALVSRSMWKYRHDHAYRVLLLDAGHLGQTLQLICTQLGVAAATSSAKNDRLIEKTLGIDGVEEI